MRNLKRLVVVLAALPPLTVPFLAQARPQQIAEHDIHWYETNDAARSITLKMCQSDSTLALNTAKLDCENAERAGFFVEMQRGVRRTNMDDPIYWMQQGQFTILGMLGACARGERTIQPHCSAIATAAVRFGIK